MMTLYHKQKKKSIDWKKKYENYAAESWKSGFADAPALLFFADFRGFPRFPAVFRVFSRFSAVYRGFRGLPRFTDIRAGSEAVRRW
jgi:hypothetical protein